MTHSPTEGLTTVAASVLVCSLFAAFVLGTSGCKTFYQDPANSAPDPSTLRDDSHDRRAARAVERSRGIKIGRMLADPERDLAVVSRLFESLHRRDEAESSDFGSYDVTRILLIRRARATYVVAVRALEHRDPEARLWGLGALEVVEGRFHGPSPGHEGPAYQGPERDRALAMVGRLCLTDPDPEIRGGAVFLALQRFPKAGTPSTDAVVSALARESNTEIRRWMLWLLSERQAPAEVIFRAALEGFDDPITVSVAIHDLFDERNRGAIEIAFERGDRVCRSAIGETFYRHQTNMPWAEEVVFKGLTDPDRDVRERFAKGSLVLRPASPRLRGVLESLREETECAAWALRIMDEAPGGTADADE